MAIASNTTIHLSVRDWERILHLGTEQHAQELETELAEAEESIAAFEKRFGMPLSRLEEVGLPDDADFDLHEAYIEWCSWESRREDIAARLNALHELNPTNAI